MDCIRTHTLTLSHREIAEALKIAYPNVPLVAAIPEDSRRISIDADKASVTLTYKSTVPLLSSATDLAVVAS